MVLIVGLYGFNKRRSEQPNRSAEVVVADQPAAKRPVDALSGDQILGVQGGLTTPRSEYLDIASTRLSDPNERLVRRFYDEVLSIGWPRRSPSRFLALSPKTNFVFHSIPVAKCQKVKENNMTEPNNTPVSLSQEERNEIAEKMATCPFVGTAVATGLLPVLNSAENPLAAIDEIARLGDLGGGDLGTHVLKLFARGNHSRWVIPALSIDPLVPGGTFSLQFGGSQGAHAGHSGILLGKPDEVGCGRFDQAAFDRLAGYADPAGRLSIDSIGDFIADNLKRDPNAQVLPAWQLVRDTARLLKEFHDVLLGGDESERTQAFEALTKLLGADHLAGSAGEWGLLFAFLKNSPNSDDGDIALSDVKEMFVDKRFPAGWETWEKSTLSWIKATLRLTKDASFAYHVGWK